MEKESTNDIRLEYRNIYTSLDVAKREVWRRWNDKELRKKVEDFLGGDIPEIFKNFPRSVLGRHVLSPNFELLHFLQLANTIGLRPLCVEYLHDKFVSNNIDKFYLSKLLFYNSYCKKEEHDLPQLKIMDLSDTEGKSLCDLKTIWGGSLVEFHHEIFRSLKLSYYIDNIDISDYLKIKGGVAIKYYIYYLALYICHGVLFENYLVDRKQVDFTEKVVLPSCKKIGEIFGVKPLIVPLVPFNEENDLHWRFYPECVKNVISCSKNKNI